MSRVTFCIWFITALRLIHSMFREITAIRQYDNEPRRRWFSSNEQDLFVWHNDKGAIVAFQLCYSKLINEHAIYWRGDRGYAHVRVGNGIRGDNILDEADAAFDKRAVLDRFARLSADLPALVKDFVTAHVAAYPLTPAPSPRVAPAKEKPWWLFW